MKRAGFALPFVLVALLLAAGSVIVTTSVAREMRHSSAARLQYRRSHWHALGCLAEARAQIATRPTGVATSWSGTTPYGSFLVRPLGSVLDRTLFPGAQPQAASDGEGPLLLPTADVALLSALPGLSPATAREIAEVFRSHPAVGSWQEIGAALAASSREEVVRALPDLVSVTTWQSRGWNVQCRGLSATGFRSVLSADILIGDEVYGTVGRVSLGVAQ